MKTLTTLISSGASTRYEDFPFNSFFELNGIPYGVADDGLYRLDDKHAPVDARIDFGRTDFGTGQFKRLRNVWLGVACDIPMALEVSNPHGFFVYEARRGDPKLQQQRVDCGLGLRANWYDLILFNQDGAEFELASLEANVETLKRRI
jgi:hypothetical protein